MTDRMGDSGICPKCGGVGTRWTGEKRILCDRCDGTGTIFNRRWRE